MDKLDILNRESFVDQLMRLVENISTGEVSVSFAIDGTWGCGKSFVLDMFEKELSQVQSAETSTDRYLIIRYNCWKYDYYKEPLIAIVATITDAINEKIALMSKKQQEIAKVVLNELFSILISMSNDALKVATKVDISEHIENVKEVVETGKTKYIESQKYDTFFNFRKALQSLQNALNKICKQYVLVFLVDELDRCLPEYAIKVLERLHHLTENTKKVITIIAIDKTQLKTSIQQIFGFSNTERYLRKFIQFSISLNVGTVSEKIANKFTDYTSLFCETPIANKDSIEEYMKNLFAYINIREQEYLIQKAMLVHKVLYTDTKDYSFMCMELLIIIIESCYSGNVLFTDWYDRIGLSLRISNTHTPFSDFLGRKFNGIHTEIKHHTGAFLALECVFKNTDSIYSVIAYTWHELYLKQQQQYITIQDAEIKKSLDKNVMELKKFVEAFRLIK